MPALPRTPAKTASMARARRRKQRRFSQGQLVLVGDTAVAMNMARRDGRVLRGHHLVCKVPFPRRPSA
jgi:hypothetical protein